MNSVSKHELNEIAGVLEDLKTNLAKSNQTDPSNQMSVDTIKAICTEVIHEMEFDVGNSTVQADQDFLQLRREVEQLEVKAQLSAKCKQYKNALMMH